MRHYNNLSVQYAIGRLENQPPVFYDWIDTGTRLGGPRQTRSSASRKFALPE
jgi:hypothetical protein